MLSTPSTIQSITIGTTVRELISVTEWTYTTWLKVSSGVVTIGTDADLNITATGKGMLLPVDAPVAMLLAPSTRIYAVGSTTLEAVAYHTQRLDFISKIVELLYIMSNRPAPKAVQTMPYPGQPEFRDWVVAQKRKKG